MRSLGSPLCRLKSLTIAFSAGLFVLAGTGRVHAGANPEVRLAIDIQELNHKRLCPATTYDSCEEINWLSGQGYVQAIVVLYNYHEVTEVEYALDLSDLRHVYFYSFKSCSDSLIGGTVEGDRISCVHKWDECQYSADPPPGTSGIAVGWIGIWTYAHGGGRIEIVPSDGGNLRVVDCSSQSDDVQIVHPGSVQGAFLDPGDLPPCDGLGDTPRVIHVPGDPGMGTIQAGIDSASSFDTVLVADGVYTGEQNRDIDFHGKHVVVISENGPEHTIIDCQAGPFNRHRAFTFHNDEVSYSVVEGFTIRNGYGPSAGGHNSAGGGISCEEASPMIKNCIFERNSASGGGGALYCYIKSHPLVIDCSFSADTCLADGGAVGCYGSHPLFSGCLFINNRANGYGGAVDALTYSYPVIRNCTLVYNAGATAGGGIASRDYGYPFVENTIVAFSSQGEGIYCEMGSDLEMLCSDIYGNAGGDSVGCAADQLGQNGNISLDPLFCDPDAELTLQAGSPCLPANNPCGELIGSLGQGCIESFDGDTYEGENVELTLGPVAVTFDTVTTSGVTTLIVREEGPDPPSGFQVVPSDPARYYDLGTEASFTGDVEVCLTYDDSGVVGSEGDLTFMHFDLTLPEPDWVDVTTSLDTVANVICGVTDHFSTFALMEIDASRVGTAGEAGGPGILTNHPNPFNPMTTITYVLPAAGHLELTIHDVRGRAVKNLVRAAMPQGVHRACWDGTDRFGSPVASGVYFYRLEWNGGSKTRRMVLVR